MKVFFALLLAVSSSRGNSLHGSVAEDDVKHEAERYKWDDKEEQIAVTDYSLEAFPKQHDVKDDNFLTEREGQCHLTQIIKENNCARMRRKICECAGLSCRYQFIMKKGKAICNKCVKYYGK